MQMTIRITWTNVVFSRSLVSKEGGNDGATLVRWFVTFALDFSYLSAFSLREIKLRDSATPTRRSPPSDRRIHSLVAVDVVVVIVVASAVTATFPRFRLTDITLTT